MAKEKRTSAEMFPLVEEYLDGDLTLEEYAREHHRNTPDSLLLTG